MQGLPFVKNGITLLSGHDPVSRCEKTADAVTVHDRTLFFCPSPLYGYGLERLLSRLESEAPNSAVLCIEADPELYELSLKNIDLHTASGKRLRITNICEAEDLYEFIREAWGAMAFRRIETIRLTGGWQLFPDLYSSLCETLRREIAVDWSNALTLAKLGRLYIRNALRNLSLVTRFPSIENLSFDETPVLVFGAGPSLDETINALDLRFADLWRNLEKRPFRIICVDTCLGALKDRNIIPDLVVILESQHWNLRDFTGCVNWNVPAAVDLSALPQSARILSGGGFLFATPWTRLRLFERLKSAGFLPAIIPPLGSVGLSAVEIARRVSRGKIICCGIDFSFTLDKYHARNTPGHRAMMNTQNRFRKIINAAAFDTASFSAVSKEGSTVRSSHVMRHYRSLFEQEFGGDKRLFDITGSGLTLGLKTLRMDEALSILADNSGQTEGGKMKQNVNVFPREKLVSFIDSEIKLLDELKKILTGEDTAQAERLNVLIDECDYLWAHFPDYSGGRCPAAAEIACGSPAALSFLKRVRVEIDQMLQLYSAIVF